MRAEQASERINSIFLSGERLAGFYAFIMSNPHISFWNGVQIYSARPSVTVCKSFDDWHNQDNRRIKRGERGIVYYDENRPNRKAYVFDLSQTYGSERFHGVQHKMRESQLRDFINSQNVMFGVPKKGENEVYAAVYRYCEEHVADGETDEYNAEYLACLAEGVTQCMNAYTGNKCITVAPLPFDENTNFRLCTEVIEISEGLQDVLVEYEQAREEKKKEKERQKAAKHSFDLDGGTENEEERYSQLSLWELAAGIPKIGVSETVSNPVDDGAVARTPYVNTKTSEGDAGTVKSTDATEQIIFELPDERPSVAPSGAYGRGDSSFGSSVSAVHNYRLTDENFNYPTGAKTRFRQNVEAIKLMHKILQENRLATDEEKSVLSKYVGWGGLAYAFDPDKLEWSKEYTELRELLDSDEYRLARESVLSAHYTPKTVIDGIYAGLKRIGFDKGKILEPAMGIGNFIGLLPNTFNAKETYGVEIDEITGNIARLLYPETKVKVQGFEKTNFADNSFDGVITNVPFGSFKVHDAKYDRFGFFIHNYFFAKSLDKVRPGGIIAAITTKGTLDKKDPNVRQYIANRAKLLGAIRLPNNAFKTSAGTAVTADILFFQKRDKLVEKANDSWINIGVDENGVPVNQYYIDHPEMLLGTMAQHKSMYGSDDETELMPDDRELGQAIAEAVAKLPENVYDIKKAMPVGQAVAEAELPIDEEHSNLKNFCYVFIGDTLYQRERDTLYARDIARTNIDRMRGLIELRKQVRQVLNVQLENSSDEVLQAEQRKLNRDYDKFVKAYGIVNSKLNRSLFREDADYALLISIEKVDEKTGTAKKTDVFSKRTIKPYQKVTHCNGVRDALNVCKSEHGVVDLKVIEQLTGKTYDEVVEELGDKIYRNPAKCLMDEDNPYLGWEDASEYLSGNVRKKLEQAEFAVKGNEKYRRNVEALRLAQPAPLEANDISVKIGVSWIDAKYYHQFISELLDVHYYLDELKVGFNNITGEWTVERPAWMRHSVNAISVYGTERMDAFKIFEKCLNQQTPTITDEVDDGEKKKRVTNKKETIAAREKQRKINDEFKRWIFDEPKRREYLVNKYNEIFNTTVVPQFDGSYLEFPGMNPEITLKPYQKDAVDRILQGNNVLLHHSVGAGKTFEIAAACMKLKECGTSTKPIIVVPNHLVVQWANEIRTLYPNANVLMATKKDFEKTSRKRFVAKVATGDWDAVVIAMSSFEKIPISRQRQEDRLNKEIIEIEIAIRQVKEEKGERIRVKDLQRTLKNKRAQLEKLMNTEKKDDLLQFEDLGGDYIFVDEAHKYKNKFIFTKMNNVSGISRAMSQRSSDMDVKCEYIGEMRGGDKGVVFATGTPISNSLVEMYTLQTYLQRNGLREVGLQFFDSWAALYTETVTALELAPSGQGYRTRTRVAKFTNLPELLKMYRSFADVKTADMLNLPVPNANKEVVEIEPTDKILELNEDIVSRSERISDGNVEPWEDNMLCVTHDGKMIALDPRCFDKTIPDDDNSKINRCVDNIYKIWAETAGQRSTQVVFCDMSTPKKMYGEYNPKIDFDVYNDIKRKLIECGVPEEEIAYIHEAKTDQQKQDIFDRVRNGDIRVFLGSTEKCGAGTNFQNKLVDLHHLDTPYRPSDLEQREGRIVRQGNENKEVSIFTYVTRRTFDAYSYQILETKQRFISQINRGDLSVRVAEDIDDATLNFAEIKALTSGNPKIKRKMEIEVRLGELSDLEKVYRDNRYAMQSQILHAPEKIQEYDKKILMLHSDIALRTEHENDIIQVGKNRFVERKDAGALLIRVVSSGEYIGKTVGYLKGFAIIPQAKDGEGHNLKLVGTGSYTVHISESDVGTISRMENCLKGLDDRISDCEQIKAKFEQDLLVAREQVGKPFEQAEEVGKLREELAEIDTELDLNRQEEMIVMDEDSTEKPVVEMLVEDDDEEESEVA